MEKDYNKNKMIEKKERNQFVVAMFLSGKTTVEIEKLLKKAGYPKIARSRIWDIWNNSDKFERRKNKIMFCNFCLKNYKTSLLYFLKKTSGHQNFGRICAECLERLLPKQLVKQDDTHI